MYAGYVLNNEGAGGMGHAGMYVTLDGNKYNFFELIGISKDTNGIDPDNAFEGCKQTDYLNKETIILSSSKNEFPNEALSEKLSKPGSAAVLLRIFDNKTEMECYLKEAGFDSTTEFSIKTTQATKIYEAALSRGKTTQGYNLINNSCGIYARDVLTTKGSGIKRTSYTMILGNNGRPYTPSIAFSRTSGSLLTEIANNAIPKIIGANLMIANKHTYKEY